MTFNMTVYSLMIYGLSHYTHIYIYLVPHLCTPASIKPSLYLILPPIPSTMSADIAKYRAHCRLLILEHAQALYGAQYPLNHTWSVITSKTNEGRYKAHVIVYQHVESLRVWTALKSGEKSRLETAALDNLLEGLRVDLGVRLGG
jgi:hypothetical protein